MLASSPVCDPSGAAWSMGAMTVVRSLLVALLLLALAPTAALAAPPPNDARADARTIPATPPHRAPGTRAPRRGAPTQRGGHGAGGPHGAGRAALAVLLQRGVGLV